MVSVKLLLERGVVDDVGTRYESRTNTRVVTDSQQSAVFIVVLYFPLRCSFLGILYLVPVVHTVLGSL